MHSMDGSEFSTTSPGWLAPVEGGQAFVPNPLPPELGSSWALQSLLDTARGALGELVGQARHSQNQPLFTRPLLHIEAGESNRIEGTQTQVGNVLLQEAGVMSGDSASTLDNREVLNYVEALERGAAWVREERPLSLYLIRSLHEVLLKGTRGSDKRPGAFRERNVVIGRPGDTPATAKFVPPPHEQVQPAMQELAAFLATSATYPPLVSCALMHYQFETIHPFEDGNGRLGRLLMPLYLMAKGVIETPVLMLSPYFESHRDTYTGNLREVSVEARWEQWLQFFLEGVRIQSADARARLQRVEDLRDRYRSAVRAQVRTKSALAVVDLVMDRVVVSVPDVEAFAGVHYHTARAAIDGLVALGILEPAAGTFPQRWWASELIDAAYRE